MIKEFVDKFMENKEHLEAIFKKGHPETYEDIVCSVISVIGEDGKYGSPDKTKIHEIDDGDYQGTLLFVIAANNYQPSDYWYVMVSYGSCSGCDTLQAIRDTSGWKEELPTDQQVKDYMTLALHIVQGLKKIDDDVC